MQKCDKCDRMHFTPEEAEAMERGEITKEEILAKASSEAGESE